MPDEQEPDLEMEIAHVLLIDIVGYSKLLVNDQIKVLHELNCAVRQAKHFLAAEASGKLRRLPTGDGMALLFFDAAEAPVLCALEISAALKDRAGFQIRMGIHSGPIKEVSDVNDRSNFAGAGINVAQRVLDCGDGGHILLSKRSAEDLSSYRRWHAHLHDLGECEVKHGAKLHLYSLCRDGLGNPALPTKIQGQRHRASAWPALLTSGKSRRRGPAVVLIAAVGLALLALSWAYFPRPHASKQPERSIAVLPFGGLGPDPHETHFAAGVQENILTDLSKVADLKVISRNSVMHYQPGTPRNLQEIARSLGVSHVLEGNVQRANNKVRVFTQLIETKTGVNLWAHRYNGDLQDVFAIQSEIAAQIVAQLKATLSPSEKAALDDRPTRDMVAYDLYVRGKAAADASNHTARGKEELDEAVKLLTQAVARDPSFFLAHYHLADAHDQIFLRYDHSAGRLGMAETAIEALQRLRPNAGETHLARAKHLYWGFKDYARARGELKIAQSALPNDPMPPLLSGYIARREGSWDDALKNLLRARELDPRNSFIVQQIALAYFNLRRFKDIAVLLERAIEVAPEDIGLRVQRAAVDLDWRGDTRPLHEAIDSIVSSNPAAAASIADMWLYLSVYERDAASATRALDLLGNDACYSEGVPLPRSWCEGLVARIGGNELKARNAFQRADLESKRILLEQPDHAGAICAAAVVQASLGNKEWAIREGRRAVELLPVSKDAVEGPLLVEYLALIYAQTGEVDSALEQLALLAAMPSSLSYGNLSLNPNWDPLREEPRFKAIVTSLAPEP